MEYSIQTTDEQTTVRLEGRLTFQEQRECRRLIADIAADGSRHNVLELSQIEEIDVTGMGLLLLMKDACLENDQDLYLSFDADGPVAKALSVARFDEMISYAT